MFCFFGLKTPFLAALLALVFVSSGFASDENRKVANNKDDLSLFRRDITVDSNFLRLPVKNDAKRRWIYIHINEHLFQHFVIGLPDCKEEADFCTFIDLKNKKGKLLTIEAERFVGEERNILDTIDISDKPRNSNSFYEEERRNQVHFSSKRGWINDPVGMFYYDGLYHLHYQHNPFGWSPGNAYWGHAVSKDMVHWQELPSSICPDEMGAIYSGSAIVDEKNITGLKSGKEDPIIAFYTAAGGRNLASQQAGAKYTQCIAYSTDGGFTWKKYEHNPIISNFAFNNRDPYVFWHEQSQKWVMVYYVADEILVFLNSNNFLDWQEVGLIHGFYECPNLLELPVDGNNNNKRWVIYGGDCQYYIGNFNGKNFQPHNEEKYALFQGNTGYAASTFDNMPDDRCVQMSWAKGTATPGMPFNQTMNFPVTLELKTLDEGVRLVANPIKEIESLHREEYIKTSFGVEGVEVLDNVNGELFHIKACFVVADNQSFGLRVRGVDVIYDNGKEQLVCLDSSPSVKTDKDGKMRLEILVDKNNIVIFANGGEVYMPMRAPLADKDKNISLIAKHGLVEVERLEVYKLTSIWQAE